MLSGIIRLFAWIMSFMGIVTIVFGGIDSILKGLLPDFLAAIVTGIFFLFFGKLLNKWSASLNSKGK